MEIIKTIVILKDINGEMVDKPILEFYTHKEPSKDSIKSKIEIKFGGTLVERNYSPSEGGDFGAFFYMQDMYITYNFTVIKVEVC